MVTNRAKHKQILETIPNYRCQKRYYNSEQTIQVLEYLCQDESICSSQNATNDEDSNSASQANLSLISDDSNTYYQSGKLKLLNNCT